MKILYISSVPSKAEFERLKTTERPGVLITTYGMNESGVRFHTLIMQGICKNGDNEIYSLVGRSVSHSANKGLIYRTRRETVSPQLTVKHIGFVNYPVVKQLGTGISFFFSTLSWLAKNKRTADKGIIMDASYVTALPFVNAACKLIPCKKTAIFCDIYDYMGDVHDASSADTASPLRRALRNMTAKSYAALDSMVFLTEAMNDVVNRRGVPHIVMEGLVDIDSPPAGQSEEKAGSAVIMYAGALRRQYGLEDLVNGFMAFDDSEARLWIMGDGDYRDDIALAAKKDPRIVFFGRVKQEEVLRREREAALLINPRPADMEFTKYSFPSKNMEYAASGTPLLTTKLPGMPHEYYDYVYLIDGSGSEAITKSFNELFHSHTPEELREKGLCARKFILENKNNLIQSKRICDLLKGGADK